MRDYFINQDNTRRIGSEPTTSRTGRNVSIDAPVAIGSSSEDAASYVDDDS